MLTRRRIVVLGAAVALLASPALAQDKSIVVASTTSTGFRPVRAHPAAVQGQDRHRREGRVAGHRPSARYRPARRRRRGLRPRQAAGGEVRRRRLRREAPSGDVQRLHPGRAQERPRRRQGQGHHRRIEGDQGQGSTVHLARRPVTHAAELALWKLAGVDIAAPTRGRGTARSAREWERRSTPPPPPTPMCSPTAAPGSRSRTAATRHRGRRRQQALQPVRRDPGESGQACAREEGPRPGLHRLARLAGGSEGDRRLQDQRRATVLPQRHRAGS